MEVPPFNRYLGAEVVCGDERRSEVVLELAPHHLNRRGVAHGGVISSLLDSALGAAVIASIPQEWWCATTSLSTQFLEGAGRGRLTATGRLLRRGRAVAFAAGEVHDEKGRLIATATGSWHLWPYKPGRRQAPGGPYLTVKNEGGWIRAGKILAVGRNYAAHNVEMGAAADAAPVFFFKPASALVHDGCSIACPAGAGSLHHEVELVVAIGGAGKAIPEEHALDHVLGYAVGLDMTLRDLQSQAKQRGDPWSLAKGFDGAAPVSAIAPRDQVGDGSGLAIALDVNGEARQRGNTSQMTRTVPELIAHLSKWITLERGDLIFTGTPAGVGPVFPGDRLEARIERVGALRVTVAS